MGIFWVLLGPNCLGNGGLWVWGHPCDWLCCLP